jgi:hypothetical protein
LTLKTFLNFVFHSPHYIEGWGWICDHSDQNSLLTEKLISGIRAMSQLQTQILALEDPINEAVNSLLNGHFWHVGVHL